jgi:hypothetical protein
LAIVSASLISCIDHALIFSASQGRKRTKKGR